MAAAQEMTRKEERAAKLMKNDSFRENALTVIKKMVELNNPPSEHTSVLVDEVLHSIFFLGKINTPQWPPEKIVTNYNMLNDLKGCYPESFNRYSSQLPKRSPISCVLDMIVILTGQERENEIIQKLQQLMKHLKEGGTNELISSTICVSQRDKTPNSVRYYGVSMSTSGCNPGRVIVAASCLSNWDSYVAGAVMGYILKRDDFDGTISLPESVRCRAYNISQGKRMRPCRSCGNLFGLETSDTNGWAYGNCAEVESVSNLLKNEREVREQVQTKCTDAERERARERVMKELMDRLRMLKFKWDKNFYTPQAALL